MERRILLVRIEPDHIPSGPGHAQIQAFDANLQQLTKGWTIVSHTATFHLDGALIVSMLIEKEI